MTWNRAVGLTLASCVIVLAAVLVLHPLRVGGSKAATLMNKRMLGAIGFVFVALVGVALVTGVAEAAARLATTRSLGPRAELYGETLRRWSERPILGWGTEIDWLRDVPESGADVEVSVDTREAAADSPPLGSHSQYLGILFKQGALGLVAFAAILVLLLAAARAVLSSRQFAIWLVVAAMITTLISGVTESLWLDPAAAIIVAITWGLVLSLARPATTEQVP